jgi:hypothetical protein
MESPKKHHLLTKSATARATIRLASRKNWFCGSYRSPTPKRMQTKSPSVTHYEIVIIMDAPAKTRTGKSSPERMSLYIVAVIAGNMTDADACVGGVEPAKPTSSLPTSQIIIPNRCRNARRAMAYPTPPAKKSAAGMPVASAVATCPSRWSTSFSDASTRTVASSVPTRTWVANFRCRPTIGMSRPETHVRYCAILAGMAGGGKTRSANPVEMAAMGIPSNAAVSGSWTMTSPPASCMSLTPRDPSLPVPDKTTAIALSPMSFANE